MSTDVNKMVAKINFARASLLLKNADMVDQYLSFPTSKEEEEEAIRKMVYAFIKKRFTGCKLRSNAMTFSLRLDGEIHRKVKLVRDKVLNDPKWKKWFQEHHREMFRTIERHTNIFQGDSIEFRQKEGRDFLYIPVQQNRIRNFQSTGLMNMFTFLNAAYEREQLVSGHYDDVIRLMEAEIHREREETRLRIEGDQRTFEAHIKANLIKPITRVNREGTTFEDKLEAKMYRWCQDNGVETAVYAREATYERVIPIGTNVDIIVRDEDLDEDWYVVPTFGGYDIPEGFTLMDGYGDVTGYEKEGRRSRDGASPIIVINHMYCQYDVNLWKAHFPERYDEILEATRIFTAEAQAECALAEEQRKELERLEAEERRARQEADLQRRLAEQAREAQARAIEEAARATEELARQEAEEIRLRTLRDQLLAQLEQTPPIPGDEPPVLDPNTFPNGLYLNARAIPLERYVSVYNGVSRRHANRTSAIERLRTNLTWAEIGDVHDFYDHAVIVEKIER